MSADNEFKLIYSADKDRFIPKTSIRHRLFVWFFRKSQTVGFRFPFLVGLYFIESTLLLEIPATTKIGKGVFWGHLQNITINPKSEIGEYCTIMKGVTIGQEMRGGRAGCPQIGDYVYVGINAVVVGKIKIGNDVLIAPNSFVNCDIPDHSVVFGNPCIIKHRDHATEGYLPDIISDLSES